MIGQSLITLTVHIMGQKSDLTSEFANINMKCDHKLWDKFLLCFGIPTKTNQWEGEFHRQRSLQSKNALRHH